MIRYVSGKGQEIRLDDGRTYIPQSDDLRDFDWDYEAIGLPMGSGGRVDRFYCSVREKTMEVGIRAESSLAMREALNHLHAVTEADIREETPGRLYIGEQYATCFMAVGSKIKRHVQRLRTHFVVKELRILMTDPFWTTEEPQRFAKGSGVVGKDGLRYPGRYPYRYGTGFAAQYLSNTHFAQAPCVMTVYGPCSNPVITIAGNQYGATVTLLEGEKLILDQIHKTVTKVGADGHVTNLFNMRTKVDDPFKPIPAGQSSVRYNGNYAFDVTLHHQRSEPEWT